MNILKTKILTVSVVCVMLAMLFVPIVYQNDTLNEEIVETEGNSGQIIIPATIVTEKIFGSVSNEEFLIEGFNKECGGTMTSYAPDYLSASEGSGSLDRTLTYAYEGGIMVGQSFTGSYYVLRTYMSFDTYAIPSEATVTSASIHFEKTGTVSPTKTFDIHIYTGWYQTPFSITQWNLNSPEYLGIFVHSYTPDNNWQFAVDSSHITTGLGTTQFMLKTSREGTAPTDVEIVNFGTLEADLFYLTVNYDIPNPVADAGSDQSGNRGIYNFDGTGSYALDGAKIVRWTFMYGGNPQSLTTFTPQFNFQIVGSYEVTLYIEDDWGFFDTDIMWININNQLPVANAGTDQSGLKGIYNFNGGGSHDPDGSITDYSWEFFYDGSTRYLTTSTPNFDFQIGGVYTVTLTVTDNDSDIDTDVVIISITNRLPVANAGTDQSGLKGIYDFDGGGSYDLDGSITDYSWEFTYDGSLETLSGVAPDFDFQIGGVYTVTLTVIGDEGDIDTDDVIISITNRLPVADAGVDQIGLKGIYVFDGTGSYDLDGSITDYSWTFIYDGSLETLSTSTPQFDFQIAGVYTVTLTVTGDEGDLDIDIVLITIINELPVANAGLDQFDNKGIFFFDGSTSYDPDGSITDYSWEFFYDGSTRYLTTSTPQFDFQILGSYIVTLTVTDDDGDIDTDEMIVNVNMIHSPFRINSDIDFTLANGVTSGTGTVGDPYLIDGWIIDGTGYGACMYVGNTTKYFEIINCEFFDASGELGTTYYKDSGVYLYNVEYGKVVGNFIHDNNNGVIIENSDFINTTSNIITYNDFGIHLANSDYNNITFNNIQFTTQNGIYLKSIENNITNNNIENSGVGIRAEVTANNNLMYHNDFINNALNIVNLGSNTWDLGYQFGGNYYYPNSFVDNYHGENQDILNSDYINDNSLSPDNYPLMQPYITNNIPIADAGIDLWYQQVHHVNGMNSSDAGGTSLNYTWTFTYNSIPYTFWGVSFDFDFVIMGNYTVTLTLKDDTFNTDVDTLVVHIVPFVANAGLDDIAYRQIPYQFDGTGSMGDISDYKWTFNDGGLQEIHGITPFYTFTTIGVYNVTLNITETNGLYDDEDWVWITVLNAPPVADAGTNQAGARGIYNFDASNSIDVDGSIISYEWTFNDIVPQTLLDITPSYNFTNTGIFTIMLKVTDNDGGIGFDNITVTIINQLPIANAGINQAGQKGTYIISGNASYDPDGTITNYEWILVYNSTTYHFYNSWFDFYFYQYGDYEITLKVTDNDLDFVEDTTWVNITWLNPVAYAGTDIIDKRDIMLIGSGSYDDDGTIVDYTWTFNDGGVQILSGVNPTYDFNNSGIFIIMLTVIDNDGLKGYDNVTVTVNIASPVAVITISPISTNKGTFSLGGFSSTDSDGSIINYKWTIDYGGLQTFIGASQSFDFLLEGTYEITLTVTDDDWRTDIDIEYITIDFKNPVAVSNIYVNDTLKGTKYFDATGSSDEDGTISTYDWMFTYNSIVIHKYGDNVSHDFLIDGMYNVTLTVIDDDGRVGVKEFSFWIIYQPPVADAGEDVMYMTDNNNTFLNITLNGSLSYDVDGSIVNYTWSYVYYNVTYELWGENPILMINTNDSFAYNITLVVTDDNGLQGNATVLIHVMSPIDVVQYFIYWLIILTIVLFAIKIILKAVKKAKDPLDTQASGKKFSAKGKKI